MTSVFFSYSHADEALRDRLEKHLSMLKRQGVIDVWHDRRLPPGDHIDHGISEHLERADLILLLVSPDFLDSAYCYDLEMTRVMERHTVGATRVLPVILRFCDWHSTPFGKLLATPKDGKPVVKYADQDEAFLEVTKAIKAAVAALKPKEAEAVEEARSTPEAAVSTRTGPRSSNLRTRKSFTDADRDRFLDQAFDYMASFFENSLHELCERNLGIQTMFKRLDAQTFTAVAYEGGVAKSRCRIWHGGPRVFGFGIAYSQGDLGGSAMNESLSVESDDQGLFLKPLGMPMSRVVGSDSHLSFEGGAEYYWYLFIEPLQR
jgi:hypothetical protein